MYNYLNPYQRALIGDCSADRPSNLVPIITEVAIGKREKITVFGDDYNTPDGTCIRDYIHVVDLAKLQGGQWGNVFIDLGYFTQDMLEKSYLRWLYTAMTRASKKLYLINFNKEFFK